MTSLDRRVRAIAIAVLCGLATAPTVWGDSTVNGVPASNPSFTLGPLQIETRLRTGGTTVDSIFHLETVQVAVHTLTPQNPEYAFKVLVGNATAKGTLKIVVMPPDQFSTVEGDFTVTVNAQSPQAYRGVLYYWFALATTKK